jgi:hypothetical protein
MFLLLLLIVQTIGMALGLNIVTVCPDGQCFSSHDSACVTSEQGVRCDECTKEGYIVPQLDLRNPDEYVCTCYQNNLDPNVEGAPCSPAVDITDSLDVTVVKSRSTCDPHNSKKLGFFKLSDVVDNHVYGEEGPPLPNACLRSIFGPEPGIIVETLLIPLATCNTYGAADPNLVHGPERDDSFRVCAGHGNFDQPMYRCDCDDNWILRSSGQLGADNEEVFLCDRCSGFQGPPVPRDGFGTESPPFCGKTWTADPLDGSEKQCGGHGDFIIDVDQCVCFGNTTHGHWDLSQITHTFTVPTYNVTGSVVDVDTEVTVVTCQKCKFPYVPEPEDVVVGGPGACTVDSLNTNAPTMFPTGSTNSTNTTAPSTSPTT